MLRLGTAVIRNASEGILVLDKETRVFVANPVTRRMLGWNEGFYVGKLLTELSPVKEGNEALWKLLEKMVRFGQEEEELRQGQRTRQMEPATCIYTTGEETKWLRVAISVYEEGETLFYLLMLADVSYFVELEQQNRQVAWDTLDAMHRFVGVMVTAIDARSPYNANHTRSMYKYARHFLAWTREAGRERTMFGDIDAEAFLCSVWLHDIGKLGIPSDIMDKSTRLGERLEMVLHRVDVGILQLQIQGLRTGQEGRAREEIEILREDRTDILRINQGGPLDREMSRRVEEISLLMALDMKEIPHSLLTPEEKEALLIPTGTLTKGERRVIESHVTLTEKMLRQMKFSGTYEKVPLWCGGHHELMDGTGYPRHLQGETIEKETRLLTILDIFDALTAEDRPYKPPFAVPDALRVLEEMAQAGKLDADILAEFEESRAWERKTIQSMDLSGAGIFH